MTNGVPKFPARTMAVQGEEMLQPDEVAAIMLTTIATPLAGCGLRMIEARPAKPLPAPQVAVPGS